MRTAELTEFAESQLRSMGASWMRREVALTYMSVRADVAAIVDGRIVLVEIKGASDRTARLAMQMHGYGTVADAVEVYCAPNLSRACVSVVRGSLSFPFARVHTPAGNVAEPTEPTPRVRRQLLCALICCELEALAAARGCARGVRGKSKPTIMNRLENDGITLDEARAAVVAAWPTRDWDWLKRDGR